MAPEASALQLTSQRPRGPLGPGTNSISAAFFDRYSTHIAQNIAVVSLNPPKDQDLRSILADWKVTIPHRTLGTFISLVQVLRSNHSLEHSLRVAFAGNLPKPVNDPNSSDNLALSEFLYPRTRRGPSSLPFSFSSLQLCSFPLYGLFSPGPSSSL